MSGYDDLADELDRLADEVELGGAGFWGPAKEAMQLVRRVDKDAADQIQYAWMSGTANPHEVSRIIRGAAKGARFLGPSEHGGSGSQTHINVTNQAVALATATAESSVMLSLDLIMQWPDLPTEAVEDVEAMKVAISDKDKPTMMDKASKAAHQLGAYPGLAKAIMDAATQAAQLF